MYLTFNSSTSFQHLYNLFHTITGKNYTDDTIIIIIIIIIIYAIKARWFL